MLLQHGLDNVRPPGGLGSSRSRRRGSNLLRGRWGNVRADVRTHGLSAPHPRDRHRALQTLARPTVTEWSTSNGSHLTDFARADRHDVRGRAPAVPQPHTHTVAPPGAEASVHIARTGTEEHLLAELIAVVVARLAEKPPKRCPAI
eukprot:15454320-Alexandrium_andersonii.AAC.1